MKSQRQLAKKQREKEEIKETKTKPPHSIVPPSSKVLNVSKKSQVIARRTENQRSVQSTLVQVNSENGSKTLAVSRANPRAKIGNVAVSNTTISTTSAVTRQKPIEVESEKKTVLPKQKIPTAKAYPAKKVEAIVSKDATAVSAVAKKIICQVCKLTFANEFWLEKHDKKFHSQSTKPQTFSLVDKKPLLNNQLASKVVASASTSGYKQQIARQMEVLNEVQKKHVEQSTVIERTLAKQRKVKQDEKPKGKKTKLSPGKAFLREQLRIQMEAQRQLLQVQQQIFEKANKAQDDIYKLIAKLGDDDDSSENSDEEQEEKVQIPQEIEEANVEFVTDEQQIVYKNDESMTKYEEVQYMDDSYYSHEIPYDPLQNVVASDNNYVVLNESISNYDDSTRTYADLGTVEVKNDKNVMVVVQTDDGSEEYELFEVVEDQIGEPESIGIDPLDVEVVKQSGDGNTHYRIISNDANKKANNKAKAPQVLKPMGKPKPEKVPIRLEVGNIPILGKREPAASKTQKKQEKLLNKTNQPDEGISKYVQDVVKNAIQKEDNKFECPICKELVSNRYSLGPHILRLHSKHKSKICPHCDRAFTCTGDLTRHIRIHTGDKPFKCTFDGCDYAFRASGDLHKHIRRHNAETTNTRVHVCQVCDRAFERNYDLKRHELTHDKNAEGIGYTCDYCPKRFVRKDQHKSHVLRHLGIKQYKCANAGCNRSFSDFSNCSKHMKQCQAGDLSQGSESFEENHPYVCDICLKRFKSKIGIQQHVVKCSIVTQQQNELKKILTQGDDVEA